MGTSALFVGRILRLASIFPLIQSGKVDSATATTLMLLPLSGAQSPTPRIPETLYLAIPYFGCAFVTPKNTQTRILYGYLGYHVPNHSPVDTLSVH